MSANENFDPDEVNLPSPDNIQELHDQVATLSKALAEAQEKVDSHWERLLRKEAELQNVQKRMQQDLDNARKFGTERIAGDLLQVIDSIEQGLTYANANNDKITVNDLKEGMSLTLSVLLNVFDKQGIKVIDPSGEAFNPAFHEAISIQETNEVAPNHIVAVVQKGYMLHNRLLRAARVVVAKALSTQSAENGH